jgi:hypothetical protein
MVSPVMISSTDRVLHAHLEAQVSGGGEQGEPKEQFHSVPLSFSSFGPVT